MTRAGKFPTLDCETLMQALAVLGTRSNRGWGCGCLIQRGPPEDKGRGLRGTLAPGPSAHYDHNSNHNHNRKDTQ